MLNRVPLANIPTPLNRLERISDHFGGDIWVKRDDFTESGMMGNKIRKLEYLLAEAIEQEADSVITCGAAQSNHCRATALASAKLGLKCILLLRGEKPEHLQGNLLLNSLSGAETVYISYDNYYDDLEGELNRIAANVRKSGSKAYIIPEGGSNPVGAWGYVACLQEMIRQCYDLRLRPDRIVCATGSGGTHAGLLAGALMEKWDVEIISISVCYTAEETRRRILAIINGMIDRYKLNFRISPGDISIIDGYIGEGYAKAGSDVFEAITEMAQFEGIIVDPVYTGKAVLGIKSEISKGNFDGTTLFVHTGGAFGLFASENRIP